MGDHKIKSSAFLLSLLLLLVLGTRATIASAQDQKDKETPKKKTPSKASASKGAARKSASSKTSTKGVAVKKPAAKSAIHTVAVHKAAPALATSKSKALNAAGTAVKKPLRTTATSTSRRPRVPWKDVIDRASRGNSEDGDDLNGEDPAVRAAAVEALGPLNGSVVVSDPKSGRILSIVNQRLAFSSGEQPCSTIKLPVALAALSEGLINRETQVRLNRRLSMNLVEAIAHSNNPFFENLGSRMGFEKVEQYETQFGFGELAGYHIPEEQLGTLPPQPPAYGGVARMSSFGMEVSVTPLQLAAFVSAIGNGGTLYYLQRPRTPEEEESFQPVVKRHLDVQPLLGDLRAGMEASVEYGTGRRAQTPFDTIYGKTGTCSHNGAHLGWFASFSGSNDPHLAVVVLLRGGRYAGGGHAAEVAGKVYRSLYEHNYIASDQSVTISRGELNGEQK
jgi:penicillin-binding protein 2